MITENTKKLSFGKNRLIRLKPDRAEPGFRAAGTGPGLDVNGLAGVELKVCGLGLKSG